MYCMYLLFWWETCMGGWAVFWEHEASFQKFLESGIAFAGGMAFVYDHLPSSILQIVEMQLLLIYGDGPETLTLGDDLGLFFSFARATRDS